MSLALATAAAMWALAGVVLLYVGLQRAAGRWDAEVTNGV